MKDEHSDDQSVSARHCDEDQAPFLVRRSECFHPLTSRPRIRSSDSAHLTCPLHGLTPEFYERRLSNRTAKALCIAFSQPDSCIRMFPASARCPEDAGRNVMGPIQSREVQGEQKPFVRRGVESCRRRSGLPNTPTRAISPCVESR